MILYKRLFHYVKPYLARFIQSGLCMTFVALLTTATVWMIRTVVDEVLIAKDEKKLFIVTLVFPLIFLLKGVFAYLHNYLMNYVSLSIIRDIRLKLFTHLQYLSMDFYHKNSTGRIMSRLTNDTTMLQSSIGQVPVQIIRDGLTLIFLLATIFYLHWKFALITIILFPIAAFPVTILGRKLRKAGRQIQIRMADIFMLLQEGITGNVITKVFCREQDEIKRFKKENQAYYAESMRWVRADVLGSPIMEFLGSFAASFLLWYGGKDVISGTWSTGSFFSFLGASIAAYKPVKDLTSLNSQIQQGVACAERIFELLDAKPTVVEKKECHELPPFSKEIEYSDITFSYDSGTFALNKINLKIQRGNVVAFVGPSGSGKTTLTLLLPRLFDLKEGSVLIDGTDIRNVSLRSLRRQIGIVTQETILFNDTVLYNLAYGSNDYPGTSFDTVQLQEIENAAKIANAHGFISELPNGYNTIVGEKGVRLSGGQRQRLSIARAVLRNPPILILDEATSSLDAESERLVQEAIERLMKNRTVLVVAHRLSTIRKADRIIVIDNGRIVDEGRHQDLIQSSPLYKKLYETQMIQHLE